MYTLNNAKVILNTVYSLFLLVVLVFVSILSPFNKASAVAPVFVPGHYNTNGTYTMGDFVWSNSTYYSAPTTPSTPTPTPTIYSNSANPNQVSSNSAPKTIAKAKTTSKTNTAVAKAKTPANSNLSANAISGSDSFMPSGLMEWIVFAILVLLTVILVRKVYGGSEKYHATPMKHK